MKRLLTGAGVLGLLAAGLIYWTGPFRPVGLSINVPASGDLLLISPNMETPQSIHAPLDTGASGRVYLFLSTDCPISNFYLPLLNQLSETYEPVGIEFFGVISGQSATAEEVRQHQQQFGIRFPLIWDRVNHLASQFAATHTPQAIVTTADQQVCYSGRIDDRYAEIGRKRLQATTHELEDALRAMVTGLPVSVASTAPVGCPIPSVSATSDRDITFHRDIAPLLYRECVQCHRPGQVGPFSLLTYEDAREHGPAIQQAVEKGLMPPWKAAPGFGHFENEQILTARERELITRWVESGMAAGDPADAPPLPMFRDGWQLGPPDLILTMPEAFEVPADGPDIYQHFVLPTGLTQNRLISAIEFQPGSPEVVHHAGYFIDTEGHARELDATDPAPGYTSLGVPGFPSRATLGSWGPGRMPNRLPLEMGRPLWAESDLVLQIHYHPVGRKVRDQSRLGLYFAPPTADRLVTEIGVANVDLTIPAGAENHYHVAEYVLPVDTILLNTNPHMHLLGKEAKVTAILPDGIRQPLIWIPRYDFYWQTEYVFREPVHLPAGTKLLLECWFDNSAENPFQFAHPPQTVRWGDNSTDEMAIAYFRVTAHTPEDVDILARDGSRTFAELWERYQQSKRDR